MTTTDCGKARFLVLTDKLFYNFGDLENVARWLAEPRPQFDGLSPILVIAQGHIAAVEGIIHDIETGQPG